MPRAPLSREPGANLTLCCLKIRAGPGRPLQDRPCVLRPQLQADPVVLPLGRLPASACRSAKESVDRERALHTEI